MTTIRRVKGKFQKYVEEQPGKSLISGYTGYMDDTGAVTTVKGTLPGYVWVRLFAKSPTDPGRRQVQVLHNSRVNPKIKNVPVEIGRNKTGALIILSTDFETAVDLYGEAVSAVSVYPVPAEINPNDVVGNSFLPGRVEPDVALGGLWVYVSPFSYRYDNTDYSYSGGVLDLTASVPGTANHRAPIVVTINPTTQVLSATAGTSRIITAPAFVLADYAAVATTGLRLMGIPLTNAQTTFETTSDWIDLRPYMTFNTAAGGMTSFTVAGDSGTPQTITDGNTLTVAGGTALTTTASATDTLTIDLDNTAVTPGAYTSANITVDAQGRLTAAANGTAPVNLWQVNSNVVNLVTAGDTVTVGSTSALGKLAVDGDADEVQLLIQGNGTQTSNLVVFEDSSGTDLVTVSGAGVVDVNNTLIANDITVDQVTIDNQDITLNGGANQPGFNLQANAGVSANQWFRTGTSVRWRFFKNSVAESGLNAGSNLAIASYDDSGTIIGTPFSITRSSGRVVAGYDLEIDGALDHDGSTLGVFGVTPAARAAATDDIKDALTTYGLLQGTSASPLNLDGGALTAGSATVNGVALIDGSADVVQLTVQAHSTQTSNLVVFENSSGTDLFAISNTGAVTLSGTSDPVLTLTRASGSVAQRFSGAATTYRVIALQTAGSDRWLFGADDSAESGSNAGSDFFVQSYTDAAGFLSRPLSIFRSSGRVLLGGELEIDGALNHDGSTVGFYGTTPATRPTYTLSAGSINRTISGTGGTDLRNNIYSIVTDFKNIGLFA